MNSPALGGAGGSGGDKKGSSLVDAVDVATTSAEAKLKPRSRWVQHVPAHSDRVPGQIRFPPGRPADHFHPLPFQIAHTPCITQDQAANQQRIRRLQRSVNHYFGRKRRA